MKKFLLVMLVLVLLAGVYIWRVVANLDETIAGFIEQAGSEALGTSVSVESLDLTLTEGKVTLGGLRVANPPGWDAASAFELDSITVALDLNSLSGQPLVLKTVDIGSSRVAYELRADGSNNLQELMGGMQSSDDSAPSEDAPAGDAGEALPLRIDALRFAGMDVDLTIETPDGVQERSLQLPPIEMDGVGGPSGAAPEVIAAAVGKEMTTTILAAAAKEGVNRLIESKTERLKNRLLDRLKGD